MHLKSRLVKSRHGIYYLRLQRKGLDRRISLNTKDFKIAASAAYSFGAKITLMTNTKNTEQMKFATQEELDALAEMRAQNNAIERVEAIIAKNR